MSYKPEFKKIEKLTKELHEKYPEVRNIINNRYNRLVLNK